MAENDVDDPAVRALIEAINALDRAAFFAALSPDATMSDEAATTTWPNGRTGRSSPPTGTSTSSRRATAASR